MKIAIRRQDRECGMCADTRQDLAQARLDAEQSLVDATTRLADARSKFADELLEYSRVLKDFRTAPVTSRTTKKPAGAV
jgi:hypothetical protein